MGELRETSSRRVGRYEVLEYLGSGGMSDVYAALHTGLRKRVALKVLRSSLRDDKEAVDRFLREGECVARVRHANVVDVHDVGVDQGIPFLVMELLSGETLDQKLSREGVLTRDVALDLLLPIFEAVEQVHRAGVVHRDVKPSNILLAQLGDGPITPKLVDFGIATLDERRLITGALGPIGTPAYMSPEQARGLDPVDARSDQYSLASMLFEVLTGREPFPGNDVDGVLSRVARGRFPRLTEQLKGVPRGLDDVLARATAFDPRDRYGSVREFAEALLPYASRRMRQAWLAASARGPAREAPVEARAPARGLRVDTEGVAGEQSGARISRPPRAHDSQATVRVRVLTHSQAFAHSAARAGRRKRQLLFAAVGALALALGLVVGLAHSRAELSRESVLAAASAEHDGQAPAAQLPSALSSRAALPLLKLAPAGATAVLDGALLGQGDRLPASDPTALHELRVTAPGYVPRVVLFRNPPNLLEIALDPQP